MKKILEKRFHELEGVLRQLSLPGVFSAGDKKDLAESILNVLAQTKHHLSRRRDVHLMVAKEYSWNRVAERLSELCCRVRQRVQER